MFKKIFLVFTLFWLSGCVSLPEVSLFEPTPQVKIPRIGYLVNVRPNPTHTHYGTTALTNFSKTYQYNWRIPNYIENKLEESLKLVNANPINLRTKGIEPNQVNGLLKKQNDVWIISKGFGETYRKLANELDLSAIVIINEGDKPGVTDCGVLGCNELQAKGYGLLSQSFINTDNFYSATAFYAHLYWLKPTPESLDAYLAEINHSREMTLVAVAKSSQVQPNKIDFVYPQDFNNWTESELKPLRVPLVKYIEGMSKEIAGVIKEH